MARSGGSGGAIAQQRLAHKFSSLAALFEGKVSWLLPRLLPAGTPLMIANSMPVRDVEWFWPPSDRGLRPYFSRGANGIDGTLSTALGIAHHPRSSGAADRGSGPTARQQRFF